MTWLTWETYDSFFFRGNNNFDASSQFEAEDIFPPRPGTFYGAIRTAVIEAEDALEVFLQGTSTSLKERIGSPTTHGSFRIQGTFLEYEDTLYVPVPLDIQVIQTGDAYHGYPLMLHPVEQGSGQSDSSSYRLLAPHAVKSQSAQGKWMPFEQLLKGDYSQIVDVSFFVSKEEKTGIALDEESRTVREGFLYQAVRSRLRPGVRIVTLCEGLETYPSTIRLGNGGTVWYGKEREIPAVFKQKAYIRQHMQGQEYARIYALMPGLGKSEEYVVEASGRGEWIGGWDMVKRRPKSRVHVRPAGTTRWIKIQNVEKQLEQFWFAHHSETDEIGYGLTCLLPINPIEKGSFES